MVHSGKIHEQLSQSEVSVVGHDALRKEKDPKVKQSATQQPSEVFQQQLRMIPEELRDRYLQSAKKQVAKDYRTTPERINEAIDEKGLGERSDIPGSAVAGESPEHPSSEEGKRMRAIADVLIAERLTERIQKMQSANENGDENLTALREQLLGNDQFYGGTNAILIRTAEIIVARYHCNANSLISFLKSDQSFNQLSGVVAGIDPAECGIMILDCIETFLKIEESTRLKKIEVRLGDVEDRINKSHASEEQKKLWLQTVAFDVPPDSSVNVCSIVGGADLDLDLSGTKTVIERAMKKKYHDRATVQAPLDNMNLTKQEIFQALLRQVLESSAEYQFIVVEAHGLTKSSHVPSVVGESEKVTYGFTKVNAPDDNLYIVNERASQEITNIIPQLEQQATRLAKGYVVCHPKLFVDNNGAPRSVPATESITLEGETFLLGHPVTNEKGLANRILRYLIYKKESVAHITFQDFLKMQQEVHSKQPDKKIIYVLDVCFSGSGADPNEEWANDPGTYAMFTSASENEVAWGKDENSSSFTSEFFEGVGEKKTLGRAFFEADEILNYSAAPRSRSGDLNLYQNPRAVIPMPNEKKDGEIEKVYVTAIRNDPAYGKKAKSLPEDGEQIIA